MKKHTVLVNIEDLRGEYESTYLAYHKSTVNLLTFDAWLFEVKGLKIKATEGQKS